MRTLRTSTVVLAALLAAAISFVWVALFASSLKFAVGFGCFWLWKLCTRIDVRKRKKELLLLLTAKSSCLKVCVAVTRN